MKPSHVFFGDSLMSGVRPKKKPNIYAMTSLHTIMETGTMNLVTRMTHKHQLTPLTEQKLKANISIPYKSLEDVANN